MISSEPPAGVWGMADFFAELKRRHIYRVGAAYVVVAWALTQGVAVLAQVFSLPSWIAQTAIVLLALGFPLALIAAWMIESKPHQAVASAVASKPTAVDWTLIGALAVVLLFMGYQQLAPSPDMTALQGDVNAARSASLDPRAGVSLAVLPFANLSGDTSQEFFSDGMTEEITSALVKVPSLRVVARTSAFGFKGQNKDVREMGRALGATHLIEGSVRKDGNEVRITAQLIKADDGTHLWTESYNRELRSVFAVQEEIAQAITRALGVPLGLQQSTTATVAASRAIDPESYQDYLRARAIVRGRNANAPGSTATRLLEPIVAQYPDYAPAWGLLALAHALAPNRNPVVDTGSKDEVRRVVDESISRAESAARRAIALDPNLAEAYLALARTQVTAGKRLLAQDSFAKALALDPSNSDALSIYANHLASVGLLGQALVVKQQALALDPFVPVYNRNVAVMLWLNGQSEAALAILKPIAKDADNSRRLALIYASAGRYSEAADALRAAPPGSYPQPALEEAARLLRAAPSPAAVPNDPKDLRELDLVYAYVGAPERALDFEERNVDAGRVSALGSADFFHPSFAQVRKSPRFKAYLMKTGLVEYWRAKGWPDQCRPVGADDFACS